VHDALGPGTTIAKTQGKQPAARPPPMRFAAGVTGTGTASPENGSRRACSQSGAPSPRLLKSTQG
jgi:hypothetical protein